MTTRHKVFVSFHHDDDYYKENFVRMMGGDIIDQSVADGDINDSLATDTIRYKIRDEFIRDATVTVVLIGRCTWQRKHVDWEIGSSLRDTKRNSRCGLLGVLLPIHSDYNSRNYRPHLIPPRLADNVSDNNTYAKIYDWTEYTNHIRQWIHEAFERRFNVPPNNSRPQFKYNRSGNCLDGWRD